MKWLKALVKHLINFPNVKPALGCGAFYASYLMLWTLIKSRSLIVIDLGLFSYSEWWGAPAYAVNAYTVLSSVDKLLAYLEDGGENTPTFLSFARAFIAVIPRALLIGLIVIASFFKLSVPTAILILSAQVVRYAYIGFIAIYSETRWQSLCQKRKMRDINEFMRRLSTFALITKLDAEFSQMRRAIDEARKVGGDFLTQKIEEAEVTNAALEQFRVEVTAMHTAIVAELEKGDTLRSAQNLFQEHEKSVALLQTGETKAERTKRFLSELKAQNSAFEQALPQAPAPQRTTH